MASHSNGARNRIAAAQGNGSQADCRSIRSQRTNNSSTFRVDLRKIRTCRTCRAGGVFSLRIVASSTEREITCIETGLSVRESITLIVRQLELLREILVDTP